MADPEPPEAADDARDPMEVDGEEGALDELDEDSQVFGAGEAQRLSKYIFPHLMIHRRIIDGVWQPCGGLDEGHELDSRVHRYDRQRGFLKTAADKASIERNAEVEAAYRRRQEDVEKSVSHVQTVRKWSLFERYVLARMEDEPYAKFLQRCAEQARPDYQGPQLRFEAPPSAMVVAYMDALRDDPKGDYVVKLKGGSIKTYLGGISAVCHEFNSSEAPTEARDVVTVLAKWKAADGEDGSGAFDMEADLKEMWGVTWSLAGWNQLERVRNWAMLLIAIVLFARASELTIDAKKVIRCPTYEDILLPESPSQWDADGLPQFIELALRKWKSRTVAHQGKRYAMRVHRNYLDSRFCPVTWLLMWLAYSKIKSGPIFQSLRGEEVTGEPVSESAWVGATTKIFTACGLYKPGWKDKETGRYHKPSRPRGHGNPVTNHGIRRSAAQWAGRCGGREIDVKNNGRWKSMVEFAKYMAQGFALRTKKEKDFGEDPIFKTWVWKSPTIGGESTTSEL